MTARLNDVEWAIDYWAVSQYALKPRIHPTFMKYIFIPTRYRDKAVGLLLIVMT
ncbi:Uncharacterized protein APZ42_015031 [Daphnia magna]|uniref:Uncharacterized protein n=1 Tax=Daphnia magna TaxID=35525 RepID=A0A162P4H0_9CRUS|nr:Uncharacterized protein APZ42_015031 [Daphnia magna]